MTIPPMPAMARLAQRDDVPRLGLARETGLLMVASALLMQNRVWGLPIPQGTAAMPPTNANAFVYSIAGVQKNGAAGLTWDLTGQPIIPPGWWHQYLLLIDRAGVTSVAASRRLGDYEDWNWIGNEGNNREFLIGALNGGGGRAIVGFLRIGNLSATPYTPGTPLVAGVSAQINSGTPVELFFDRDWSAIGTGLPGQPVIFLRR